MNIYEVDSKIFISVKDTGIGIQESLQDTIFDRFIQADKSTSRNREGSGIGLSLVKSLASLHCVSISLISKCGNGSEFILELPSRTIDMEEKYEVNNYIKNEFVEKINIEFSDIYF